jgi:hypothetical protein
MICEKKKSRKMKREGKQDDKAEKYPTIIKIVE